MSVRIYAMWGRNRTIRILLATTLFVCRSFYLCRILPKMLTSVYYVHSTALLSCWNSSRRAISEANYPCVHPFSIIITTLMTLTSCEASPVIIMGNGCTFSVPIHTTWIVIGVAIVLLFQLCACINAVYFHLYFQITDPFSSLSYHTSHQNHQQV